MTQKNSTSFFVLSTLKNDISREPGIITGFANLLFTNFPDYDFKVLYLVSKILTVIRLREVNNLVFKRRLLDRKAKKKGEDRPYSTRGRIQLGRLSANTWNPFLHPPFSLLFIVKMIDCKMIFVITFRCIMYFVAFCFVCNTMNFIYYVKSSVSSVFSLQCLLY